MFVTINQTMRMINGSHTVQENITGSENVTWPLEKGKSGLYDGETKPNNKAFVAVFVLLGLVICGSNGLFIISYLTSKMRTFHKTANYMYFYIHLAFADLLVGLSIPYHIVLFLQPELLHEIAVCLARYTTIAFPMTASVLSLLIVTIDRYTAVAEPLKYRILMTRKRCHFLMFGVWILALLLGVIGPFVSEMTREDIKENSKHPECNFTTTIKLEYLSFVCIPCLAIISVTISFLYIKILLTIHSLNKRRQRSPPSVLHKRSKSRRTKIRQEIQVAKTGILVLGTFYSCWLPFYIILSIQVYSGLQDDPYLNNSRLIATFPAIANSAMNCFIYAIRMPQFRRMVRDLFCNKTAKASTNSRACIDSTDTETVL